MVQEKQVEKQENSAVKLSMTVPADEVRRAYDALVAKYRKDTQVKGFRKGKVPINVLERKFGESFRAETLQNVVESALQESIREIEEAHRPLPYARPTLLDEELELDPDRNLSFSVIYDVFPEATLGEYKGLEITEPQVKITEKDEERELEDLRQRYALVIEKEEGTVEEGDIATIDYEEIDENGEAVPGTRKKDYAFTVGSGHNLYHLDTEVVGMHKAETKVFEKEYPEDFEHKELAGQKKRLSVSVALIKQRDLPDLDDDFAQDISDDFKTLDDVKKDIRSKLDKTVTDRVRVKKIDQLMEQVVAVSEVEVPASMVDSELEDRWRSFARQYHASPEQMDRFLATQGQTKDMFFADWRPSATERLKRSLLVQKMIEVEGIEVTEEEAEAQIREVAAERDSDPERILEYYKKNGMVSYAQREIAERRMFDAVLETSTIKKGAYVDFVDLTAEKG